MGAATPHIVPIMFQSANASTAHSIIINKMERTGSSDSDCGSAGTDELGSRVNVSAGGGGLEGSDLGQESHGLCVLGDEGLALAHHSTAQGAQVGLGSVKDLQGGEREPRTHRVSIM